MGRGGDVLGNKDGAELIRETPAGPEQQQVRPRASFCFCSFGKIETGTGYPELINRPSTIWILGTFPIGNMLSIR